MMHARRTSWLCRWFNWSVALVLGALCGCGGGGAQKILYVLGLGSPSVAIFTVSSSGELTLSTSVSTGSAPDAMAIDPLARFAYIVDAGGSGGPGGVSQYVLNKKTGNLTVATFSSTSGTAPASTPVETGVNPVAIAIDSSGTFVFVANQGSNSISVYTIDQVGGTLTEVKEVQPPCTANQPLPCPLPTPAAPTALATTGKMLFVAMVTVTNGIPSGSVATYTFDSNGMLTASPVSTVAVGVNPSAMQMDASGKFLFVADPGTNTVKVVSIGSSGQLTLLGSSPTGTTPVSVRLHPSGKFLYIANQGSNDISAFSIDSSGALTALSGSPFALGRPGPSYAATDSSGSLLFVAASDNTISVFTIDGSGALKRAGSAVQSIVINPVALASIN